MKNLFYLFLCFISITLVNAQDLDIDAKDVPKAVMENFKKMFPKATVEEWDKFDTFYEVVFQLEGVEKEALYTPTGEWMITEHIVKFSQLPKAIQDAFAASEFKDWKVRSCAEVDMKDVQQAYGIDVTKGKEEYALYFDATGKLVKKTED
jgi:hypothetical protein